MLDHGADQAAGLRRLRAVPSLNLMAFPVAEDGEARWIAEVTHALRALGARPLVVDATRGRLARAFGLQSRHELMDLLDGRLDFESVAQPTADGVWVLRADRGLEAFVSSGAPSRRLFTGFARLSHGFDALLLAMPAHELACLANPAAVVPVIGMPSGQAGMTHAYATVKALASRYGYSRFAAVVRDAHGAASARDAHARLATVARSFLDAEVSFAGRLPTHGEPGPALADLAQNLLHSAATPLSLH